MKKLLLFMLVAIMAVSMVGCGQKPAEKPAILLMCGHYAAGNWGVICNNCNNCKVF